MKLSTEEINKFNNDGFLILKNFASTSLCDDILEATKKHLDNAIEPIESEEEYLDNGEKNKTIRRLRQVYQREDIFKSWMINDKIRPILKQLLNDEIVLTLAHHNSIMSKMAKDSSKTTWHQDRRYWHFENNDLVSVWLALGDEYLENGLLEFIPGSHKIEFSKDQFDKKSNFLNTNEKNIALIKTAVHTKLEKGDVVLFHCKTLHAANKNQSNKNKISFVYTVRANSNKPLKNTRSDVEEVYLG